MLTSVDNTKQHQNSFYCTFWHKSESNVKYQHDTHTRHVGHIISKFSEDHTSRLFVAWLHLLAEFLQRNRGSVVVITSVQLRMNPPYTHICPSYDVLDLWPAHCSRGGGEVWGSGEDREVVGWVSLELSTSNYSSSLSPCVTEAKRFSSSCH